MFNFDVFPEDSYDADTGEYSSDFNFEPVPVDDVALGGGATAKIFTTGDENEALRIANLLQELVNAGYFDPVRDKRNPLNYAPLPDDLDRTNKRTVRGPFPTADAVEKFLDKSGLRGVGVPYYDEENDEFWIDIDTI